MTAPPTFTAPGRCDYPLGMPEIRHAVLTAIGDDRPGLVAEVTRYVLERGGNLEDSRMVNLHGQFAMMMLVAGPDEVIDRVLEGVSQLEREAGVHAELRIAEADRQPAVSAAMPYKLNTWAMDHPGLMRSIAELLGGLGVNIESVETTLRPAPYTNAPLFEMELVVSVPERTPVAELREALGRVCDDLNIDWRLEAL
jgi:glycine cleavage system transcriptional repressor